MHTKYGCSTFEILFPYKENNQSYFKIDDVEATLHNKCENTHEKNNVSILLILQTLSHINKSTLQ